LIRQNRIDSIPATNSPTAKKATMMGGEPAGENPPLMLLLGGLVLRLPGAVDVIVSKAMGF
jgi:hypothetical protein